MCDNRRLIFFSLMLLLIACVSQKSANLNVSSRNYFEDLAYIRSEEINKKKAARSPEKLLEAPGVGNQQF